MNRIHPESRILYIKKPGNIRFIRLSSITCLLLSVFCILSSRICFAQTPKSDNLVVEDTSFNYYKVIEQRNFFRPKKDIPKVEPETGQLTEDAEKPQKPEKDSLDFILTGVIEIKSGYKAIVEQISTKKGFYVSVNDTIEDYTVKAIMLKKIIIEKDSKEFELKIQQAPQKNIPETNSDQKSVNPIQPVAVGDDAAAPQTLRANTIQQIRSGTRGATQ